MLNLESTNDSELYLPSTDMRKSFDSLCGVIQNELNREAHDGVVYIFMNRLRNKMKLLHWRTGGFVLYYKRLEKGTFELPNYNLEVKSIKLSYPQLILLFDGITVGNLIQKKSYNPQ